MRRIFDGFQVCNIIAVFKNYVLYMAVNNIVPSLKNILVVHHFQWNCLNPLSPNIHIQILQTDLYTFC